MLKGYGVEGLSLVAGAAATWFFPGQAVLLFLFLCLPSLAGWWWSNFEEGRMKQSRAYNDFYWTDSQLDALEKHAAYWCRESMARVLSGLCRVTVGLLCGFALVMILNFWALSGVALMLAIGAFRTARRLDPVTWYLSRIEKNDYSVSDEWSTIMDVREKLKGIS